ncbi:hypothetical protein C8R44DRAFT_870219 [Mycena epipterygia]|nr:hypothetical protein C8R44DRAFT_870219 [Mycena epipterygia]
MSTPTESPLDSPPESLHESHIRTMHDARTRTVRRQKTCESFSSSSSKITLDLPTKAGPSVYLTVRTGKYTAFGAFSPTPSAEASLQFFTPQKTRRPSMPSAWSTPVPVPARAHTIPSICRTASASFASDLAPPSPSSAAAASLLDFDRDCTPRRPRTAPVDATPPSLASLEKRSRICTPRVLCATCHTPGTNYPACARCGAAWCSRACRLPGGMRHVCPPAPRAGTGISSPPVPASGPMFAASAR